MTSIGKCWASSRHMSVFPVAVGPKRQIAWVKLSSFILKYLLSGSEMSRLLAAHESMVEFR